jgi:hypothetical protein
MIHSETVPRLCATLINLNLMTHRERAKQKKEGLEKERSTQAITTTLLYHRQ